MSNILTEELDFVGSRRKLLWFNQRLTTDTWFLRLIAVIRSACPDTSLRNVLYALLPHSEYVVERHTEHHVLFADYESWKSYVQRHESEIVDNVIRHGTQGNIPQRAALLLDYVHEAGIASSENVRFVEMGCSAGLLGRAIMNAHTVFDASNVQEFFWLSRLPRIHSNIVHSYVGVDRIIPPDTLVPYFILDKDKREKVARFAKAYQHAGTLHEETMESFLERLESPASNEIVILITAFVLYHFANPGPLVQRIMELVTSQERLHWLDLSRGEVLSGVLGDGGKALIPSHVYLRHNGVPMAHVIHGSDDCPDWEYI